MLISKKKYEALVHVANSYRDDADKYRRIVELVNRGKIVQHDGMVIMSRNLYTSITDQLSQNNEQTKRNVKVLVNGRERDRVYTSRCEICRSVLEYTDKDVFYTTEETKGCIRMTKSHLFKADEYYTNIINQEYRCVKCPVCGNIIKTFSYRNGLRGETIRWEKED